MFFMSNTIMFVLSHSLTCQMWPGHQLFFQNKNLLEISNVMHLPTTFKNLPKNKNIFYRLFCYIISPVISYIYFFQTSFLNSGVANL